MSDLNPKEGAKNKAKVKSVDQDVGLDIENALSFIDSGEYNEVPPETQTAKPSTPARRMVEPLQMDGAYSEKPGDEKPPRSRNIEEVPVKQSMASQQGAERRETGNKPLLWVGIAVLIMVAAFFLFKVTQ